MIRAAWGVCAQQSCTAGRAASRYVRLMALISNGGPAQPSPTIAQCLNGGLGWLEVECNRCKTRASLPLDAIRRPRDTPIWKLEAALKCRSCKKGRDAPPVHMIKLTATQEITPYRQRGRRVRAVAPDRSSAPEPGWPI
jgi:hypothetical protein